MELKKLPGSFTVCQVKDYSRVSWDAAYCFIGKTDEENSLVCPSDAVPPNVIRRDDGWRGFRILGTLDFSLVGILAGISSILTENGIPIFAVSTYNTDYVFIKKERFPKALDILERAGYRITD